MMRRNIRSEIYGLSLFTSALIRWIKPTRSALRSLLIGHAVALVGWRRST